MKNLITICSYFIEKLHLSRKNIAVSADVNYFIKSFAINIWIKKFPKIGHLIISSGDKAISKVGQNGDQKKNRGQQTSQWRREV